MADDGRRGETRDGAGRDEGRGDLGYGRADSDRPGFGYGRDDYGGEPNAGGYGAYAWEGTRVHRDWWDKARDEAASWFGDRQAGRRREWDAVRENHRGKGPRSYVRSDARIAEDVNDRLAEDSWLDPSGVEVKVADGEVTLNGTVAARTDKRRAEDIAESVPGVRHVQNNLRPSSMPGASGPGGAPQNRGP